MTFEQIQEVNSKIAKIDVKGKNYALVNSRVLAFRELFPDGKIQTEIVTMDQGMVVMQTTVMDGEGKILSTGLAYEREGSTYINKTSYIENCETSAVGRALGFLGLGIDDSIASAEELVNAVTNQGAPMASEKQINFIKKLCGNDDEKKRFTMSWIQASGKTKMAELTMHEATELIEELKSGNEMPYK